MEMESFNSLPDLVTWGELVGDGGDEDLPTLEELVGNDGYEDLISLEELEELLASGNYGYEDLIPLDELEELLASGEEEHGIVPHWVIVSEEDAAVEDALVTRPFDATSDLVRECAICMEEFAEQVEISAFPCSHIFHRGCIFTWLQQRRTCPLLVYSWEEPPLI